MMETLFGGIGRVLDWCLMHWLCGLLDCDIDLRNGYCLRCGWRHPAWRDE